MARKRDLYGPIPRWIANCFVLGMVFWSGFLLTYTMLTAGTTHEQHPIFGRYCYPPPVTFFPHSKSYQIDPEVARRWQADVARKAAQERASGAPILNPGAPAKSPAPARTGSE